MERQKTQRLEQVRIHMERRDRALTDGRREKNGKVSLMLDNERGHKKRGISLNVKFNENLNTS
jgi:hypothetical protein